MSPRFLWLIAAALTLTGLQPVMVASARAAVGETATACPVPVPLEPAVAELRRLLGSATTVCALGSLPADPCGGGSVAATTVAPVGRVVDGRLAVVAHLQCDDGRQRQLPLWFSVEAQQRTAVALRPLRSGTLIVPGDFEWSERLSPVSAEALSPADWNLAGLRLARPLRAGDELRPSDLRTVSAVESGKTVEAALRQGKVHLRFEAIALRDGVAGEQIRVKRRHGGRSMPARVTGTNTVELLP